MRRILPLLLLALAAACSSGSGSKCPIATGTGVTHTSVAATERWLATDNPHKVGNDLLIHTGVTLTLDPCVEVQMAAGAHITIEGDFIAEGTAETPIRIAAADAAAPFANLGIFAPGTAKLAWVTLQNGGSDTNSFGVVEARGDQLLPAQPLLKVDNVTVTGAVTYGVSLRSGAAFTADSRDLTVSGAAKGALRVLPRLLSNVPTGKYTGNTVDAIVVETEAYGGVTVEDVTVHDRGVPYLVGGDFSIGDFSVGTGMLSTTLTVEAGVVFKFKRQAAAGLFIDSGSADRLAHGTLIANGTAEKPIVFTSLEPMPLSGDWRGITFGAKPTPANHLDHVEVRYAGAPSGANGFHCTPDGMFAASEDAAVTLFGKPSSAFITNSLIADSAGPGINLAYSDSPVDFLPTNTFLRLGGCKVTTPRTMTGPCPSMINCP